MPGPGPSTSEFTGYSGRDGGGLTPYDQTAKGGAASAGTDINIEPTPAPHILISVSRARTCKEAGAYTRSR